MHVLRKRTAINFFQARITTVAAQCLGAYPTLFFTDISSEMIVHLIPLFLANVLGVRTITIGFIEGVVGKLFSSLRSFPYNTLPQNRIERNGHYGSDNRR